MDKDKFKQNLISEPLEKVVAHWILEPLPVVFVDTPQFITWRMELANRLAVDSKNILIVGSSALGFSLNPQNNFRAFNDQSDIDVAIVSNYYFTTAWREIRNLGAKRYRLTPKQRKSIDDHRARLIFWGTVATDQLVPIFSFGKEWEDASIHMSKKEPTIGRQINYRLYMNYESLRAYHKNNLQKLKNQIISPAGGESELS